MRITFLFLFLALLLTNCSLSPCGSNKDQFLQRFDNLMEEVKEDRLPLGDEGWADRDERFRALVEECYDQFEEELSGKEKRRFWAKSAGYYKNRFGKAALDKWFKGKKTD